MKKKGLRILAGTIAILLCLGNMGDLCVYAAERDESVYYENADSVDDESNTEETVSETSDDDDCNVSFDEECDGDEVSEDEAVTEDEINGEEAEETEDEIIEEETEDKITQETEENEDEITEETEEEEITEEALLSGEIYLKDLLAKREEAISKLDRIVEGEELASVVFMRDFANLYEEASTDSEIIAVLPEAETVVINGIGCERGQVFYSVSVRNEARNEGFVSSDDIYCANELFKEWEEENLWLFQTDETKERNGVCSYSADIRLGASICAGSGLSRFPGNYSKYLKDIVAMHPNWKIVPMNTGLDFNTVVEAELIGERSEVSPSSPANWKGAKASNGWYIAKPFILKYYMDPRNFFTEYDMFQFELLSYSEATSDKSVVQSIVSGSFMDCTIPNEGKTYTEVFMEAGKDYNVSPYHLASRVLQEQGRNGTSPLISGKYSGYEGYYNFYNIKANGSSNDAIYRNGLEYAKSKGWNTRTKALRGGAEFLSSGYFDASVGQDTRYLQKFDLTPPIATHQYMQNIQAPYSEARSTAKAYAENGIIGKSYVFKIPVYENLPDTPYPDKEYVLTVLSADKSKFAENGSVKEIYVQMDGSDPGEKDSFTWTSSDTSIAEVVKVDDGEGNLESPTGGRIEILAKKPGEVKITAKYKGSRKNFKNHSGSIKITVTGIYFDDGSGTEAGEYFLRSGIDKTLQIAWKIKSGEKPTKLSLVSSDETVATVTSKGVVSTHKCGNCVITASVGGREKSAKIYVFPGNFNLVKNDFAIPRTETETIEIMEPEEELPEEILNTLSYKYASTNDRIATVDESGTVTANAPGICDIEVTMTAGEGNEGGSVKRAKVNVPVDITFAYGEEPVVKSVPWGGVCGEEPEIETPENSFLAGWFTCEGGMGIRYDSKNVIIADTVFYPYFIENESGLCVIAPTGEYTYTGAQIKPEVKVYDRDRLLVKDRDYTLSYSNNVKATTSEKKMPKITIKLKGNYSGTLSTSFRIFPKNLSDSDVTSDPALLISNGKKQKGKPVVYANGKKLKINSDYKLEYNDVSDGAYVEPGKYEITVKGIGNYAGEFTAFEAIEEKVNISKADISLPSSFAYTGKEICPGVKLTYKKIILTEGRDYTIEFTDNREIGTASVTVTGIGKYFGVSKKTFKITGTSLKGAKITGLPNSVSFTGEEITPEPTEVILNKGKKNERKLIKDIDYSLSYSKNLNAGTASVTIQGINSVTGSIKKTFKITPADIKASFAGGGVNPFTVTVPGNVMFVKGGAKPEAEVTFNGRKLVNGTDYKVKYSDNKTVNGSKAPSLTITGKKNFKGSYKLNFTIVPGIFDELTITASDMAARAKGGKCFASPVIVDKDGAKLAVNKDYTVKGYFYEEDSVTSDGLARSAGDEVAKTDSVSPGSVIRVVCEPKTGGNYTGKELSCTYRISKALIKDASVKVGKCCFDGEAITLLPAPEGSSKPGEREILVKFGKTVLKEGTDYEICDYSDNTGKGKAYVTVRGLGEYCGTKKVSFTVGSRTLLTK